VPVAQDASQQHHVVETLKERITMFKEITAHLPDPRHDHVIEFSVDLDVDNGKAIAVYTDRSNYEDLPAMLKKLNWRAKRNPLFIHAADPGKAWEYLEEKAFCDLDEE
jgi:hypothetical protein